MPAANLKQLPWDPHQFVTRIINLISSKLGKAKQPGGEISRTLKIKLDLNLRKSKGLTSIWQIDVEEVRLAPPTFQTVVSFTCSVSDAKKNNLMKLLLKLSPCMLTLRFRVQMRVKMICGDRGQKPPYQSERQSSDVNNSWILSRQLCGGKKGG